MAARKLKRSEQLPPSSPYQLLIRLAAGGMGAVYLGVRKGTSEPLFAIKRPHAHLAEETEFRKMFVAEARLASQIRHPHAVGVLDVDETDGELLMVMSYVEGGSLGELLSAAQEGNRRIPAAVAIRIVADAARGLHAAHQLTDARGNPLGIVHRDVSPQNILVGVDGRAAIVDFGVAKAVGVEATRTASDILKGKTAYMAPEYVVDRHATTQSDVFSLGVVCWEVLANRRLFKGADDVETMRRLVDPTPARMLSEVSSIDVGVSAIVARALSKDPAKRFRTAADLADALESKALAAELLATPKEVSATLSSLLVDSLAERRALVEHAMHELGIAPASRVPQTERQDLHTTLELPPESATRGAATARYRGSDSAMQRAPTVPLPQAPPSARRTLPLTPQQRMQQQPAGAEAATLVAVHSPGSFEVRPLNAPKPRSVAGVWLGLGALMVAGSSIGIVLAVDAYGARGAAPQAAKAEPTSEPARIIGEPSASAATSSTAPATESAAPSASAPPATTASQSTSVAATPAEPSAKAVVRPAAQPASRPASTSTSWKPKANPY